MWHPTHYPSYLIKSASKGAWHCFCLVSECNDPIYYPSYFEQRGLAFFVLSLGVTCALITPFTLLSLYCYYLLSLLLCLLILLFWTYVLLLNFLFIDNFFLYLSFSFWLISFLGKLVLIKSGILHPWSLVLQIGTISVTNQGENVYSHNCH